MFKESKELYYPSQPQEVTLKRKDNVVRIDKSEGTYTIIYGAHHIVPQAPEQLPDNLDGLVLETGIGLSLSPLKLCPWTKYPLESLRVLKGGRQHSYIFPKLEAKKIPIIFADADTLPPILIAEPVLAGIELYLGSRLLKKTAEEFKTKGISRRKFLELAGKATLGSYLLIPDYSLIQRGVVPILIKASDGPTAEFQKISHKLHPEAWLFLLTVRNTVLAQKEQWLMEKAGNRPHLATILGAVHCGIEDQIQYSPERRLGFLKKLKPILPRVISSKETFYQIALLNFNGVWRVRDILEVPELKDLITS